MDANQAGMKPMKQKIDANEAKTDAALKEIRAGQEHLEEEMLAKMEAKIDDNQEKMDSWLAEMRA
jgi:hypothetical protein